VRGNSPHTILIFKINFISQNMNKIILNPEYVLKKDNGRAILLTKEPMRTKVDNFETIIHPIHAMIISFLHDAELEEGINKASEYLKISRDTVESFVLKILENNKAIAIKVREDLELYFPPKTLIRINATKKYNPEDFLYDQVNLKLTRHQTPSKITFMATTKCSTDCIYCYANRQQIKNILPLDRLKKIIQEAREIGVVSFDVIGGEFFMYEYWKEALTELHKYDYYPYISTKVPISEETIKYLKSIGVKDVQISLDTLVNEHLMPILRVNEKYIERIKTTLKNLQEHGIEVRLHTILTNLNDSIEDMDSIYHFIKDMENVSTWKVDPAASTLYEAKDIFSDIKISRENLKILNDYFNILKEKRNFFGIVSGDLTREKKLSSPNEMSGEEKNRFYTRKKRPVFCAANYSDMFILPDGKVTICEELYWNPQFIIGDLTQQSLLEVWNSPKATNLYFIKENDLQKDSACHGCGIFDKCRYEYGGVCWKEIIKAYGNDNWDYPDPRCPRAPKVTNDIYV
jgi:radical SAM protein with 4Fe4S-binding SPASM domain